MTTPFTESKPAYLSKGVIGSVVAILGAVLAAVFGIETTSETQGMITDHVFEIVSAVGGLIALYGRVAASKRIGGLV